MNTLLRASGILVVVFGCGDDSAASSSGEAGSGGAATSSGGATAGGGDASASTSATSGSTGGAGAGGSEPTALVHLIGRFADQDGAPTATWSGSSAVATMQGPIVSVRLRGPDGLWFEIVVDGESIGRFETTGGEVLYPLATELAPGDHTVEIVRRNEGFFGSFSFLGFEPTEALVPSVFPHQRKIEFIGDSLTCGYGIEGPNATCDFTGDTESAFSTYAWQAAEALDAAAHLVCYSGKGVHQNYGGDLNEPMPELYPRTFTGSVDPAWDPAAFPADVVVVNLGTNDFSAALDDAAFVADYVALLGAARARHPSAYLLGVTWAHWGGGNEALVHDALEEFADTNTGTLQFSIDQADGLGCDYHTNVVTNTKLGTLLTDTLRDRLGW